MNNIPINDNCKEMQVSDLLKLAHEASLIGERIDAGKGTIDDINKVIKLSQEIDFLESRLLNNQVPRNKKISKPKFKVIKGGKN